jgi:hypothetical protein
MVIWIDKPLVNKSSHREQRSIVKTLYFEEKEIFDRFPKYGEFTLIIAKYDAFSPIITGYERFKKCMVTVYDASEGSISIKCTKTEDDGFYNMSQMAELRADRIKALDLF